MKFISKRFAKTTIIGILFICVCLLSAKSARALSSADGILREARSFSGSDYIDAGNVSDTVKTVLFWIKPNSTTEKILELNGSVYIDITSGAVAATGFTSPTIYVDNVVSSVISDTDWHYIAVVTNTAINGNNVHIGKAGITYFTGLLDEVMIYNRALSAAEVSQNYNSSAKRTYIQTDNHTGLVGAWDLDSDDYNQTTDVVYGKHGSDNLTAVSDPALTTGFDGQANAAISFDGTADYLKQKVWDTQQGVLSYQGNDTATAEFRDTTQNFAEWQSSSNAAYMIVVTNSDASISWGYCGVSNNSGADIDIYTTKAMAARGWNGTAPVAGGKTASSYEVRKTDFQITSAITLGTWFKSSLSSGNNRIIMSKGSDYLLNSFYVSLQANAALSYPNGILLRYNNNADSIGFSTAVNDGVWHLLAATFSSAGRAIYLDGVSQYSNATAVTLNDVNYAFTIGAESDAGLKFNGSIDNPFVYNRALTATEVLNLYNNSSRKTYIQPMRSMDANGLVGAWDLDSDDYNQTTDVVYGKHGSDNLTAVSDPALTTGIDNKANAAISFDGTADYLTQSNALSGSATANQLMLSTANGQAFLQHFTTDFSAYAAPALADKPYMAVIKDAALDVAWAYAGEAGSDTLGAELHTGSNAVSDPYGNESNAITGWSNYGTPVSFTSTDITPSNGLYHFRCVNDSIGDGIQKTFASITVGGLYKLTYDILVVSGAVDARLRNSSYTGGATKNHSSGTEWVSSTIYAVIDTTSLVVVFVSTSAGASEFYVDNVSIKAVTESLGAELVTNGNMETGDPPTGWTASAGATLDGVADERTGGSGIQCLDVAKGAIGTWACAPTTIPAIVVGKLYKVSGWVKNIDATNGSILVTSGGGTLKSIGSTAATSWTFVRGYFTALTTSDSIMFNIAGSTGQHVRFDDVSIKEVTAPVATGLKLYSNKTGSTQNMASTAATFGPNDATTYEVRKTGFQITGAVTMGAWVKPSGADEKGYIISKSSYNIGLAGGYALQWNGSSDTLDFVYGGTNIKNSNAVFSDNNTWVFVTATYDGSAVIFYRNGVPAGTGASVTVTDTYLKLLAGALTSNAADTARTSFFAGSIDNPFVYNRALSAAEVLSLYNSQSKVYIQ